MKRCPTCDSTYTDDALSFCPNDGTPLRTEESTPSFDPQATIMAPPPNMTQQPPSAFNDPPQSDWSTPPPSPSYSSGPMTPGSTPMTPPAAPSWGNTGGFQPPPPPAYSGAQGQQNGLAIASLVCGILSIICCFGLFTGIPAIIMGYIAMNKEKEDPARYGGKSLAIAGLITGAVGTLFGTLGLILQILPLIFR